MMRILSPEQFEVKGWSAVDFQEYTHLRISKSGETAELTAMRQSVSATIKSICYFCPW